MHSRALHAKTVTIDGVFSSVGSFNFDVLSTYRNLELNVSLLDTTVARKLEQQFTRDTEVANSTEVRLGDLAKLPLWQRALDAAAYYAARFVGRYLH